MAKRTAKNGAGIEEIMPEDVVDEAPETDEAYNDITPPAGKTWWQFESQDEATEWANDKIQKRLAREKKKYDPIATERDMLKSRVAELEPFEQATKSDSQRWEAERASLASELEDLKSFRAKAERNDLVREIAEDKGLPTRFFNRVQGNDAESITADIDDLLTVISDGKPTKPASRKPIETDEKPGQKGYGGGGSKSETDDKAIVDNIRKKFREQGHRTYAR